MILTPDTEASIIAKINLQITELETQAISSLANLSGVAAFDGSGLLPSNQHVATVTGSGAGTQPYSATAVDLAFTRSSTFQAVSPAGSASLSIYLIISQINGFLACPGNSILNPLVTATLMVEDAANNVLNTSIMGRWNGFGTSSQANSPQNAFTTYMLVNLFGGEDANHTQTMFDGVLIDVGNFTAVWNIIYGAGTNSSYSFVATETNTDVFRLA